MFISHVIVNCQLTKWQSLQTMKTTEYKGILTWSLKTCHRKHYYFWSTRDHTCLDTNNNHAQLTETWKSKSPAHTPSTTSKTKHKSPYKIRQDKAKIAALRAWITQLAQTWTHSWKPRSPPCQHHRAGNHHHDILYEQVW